EDAAMRRHAVVRQAIPGRKLQRRNVRREERQPARQRGHARRVAAHRNETHRWRIRPRGDRAREIAEDKPFGTIRNARKRERTAGFQKIGGRTRHQRGLSAREAWWNALIRSSNALSYPAGTTASPVTHA